MYSKILSFKDVLLGLAQDCMYGNKNIEVVLEGVEDYCVSMAFKLGLEQKISRQYADWFDLDDTFSRSDYSSSMQLSQVNISKVDAAREYIDEIVDKSFFDFVDYPYISKMLETIHNTFELNSKSDYSQSEDMFDFAFDFLPQFRSYIESPLENKDFETDVYELIKDDPSSIIKSIYFMGTNGIVEKEILRKLESVQKNDIVIKYPTFYIEVSKYIKTSEITEIFKYQEGKSNLFDVLSRMKHFGLIDYVGQDGNLFDIKITDRGISAYDVVKYDRFDVSSIISSKENLSVKKESVGNIVDSGRKKEDCSILRGIANETVAVEGVWETSYEGREFPDGISYGDDYLRIALDADKKNVLDILGDDGHVSNEFLCLLSTLMYEGQKDEIAKILGSNGDLEGMLLSLEEKGLASSDLESLSYQKAIETMNRGLSVLIANNPSLDEREKRIFDRFSESPLLNEVRVL